MKIYRKTYGVRNLVEWQANIPVGKGRLVVHFTGGSITAYGVTPAVFKTEDPIHQAIIEHSDYFRSGRIFLAKTEFVKEIADPVPAAAPAPVVAAAPAPAVAATPAAAAPVVEAPKVETPAPAAASATIEEPAETVEKKEEPAPAAAPAETGKPAAETEKPSTEAPAVQEPPKEEKATTTTEGGDNSGSNIPKVVGTDANGFALIEVSCTEDARQYLISTFGFTASAVRTKAYIRDKAAANKIKFTINGAEL